MSVRCVFVFVQLAAVLLCLITDVSVQYLKIHGTPRNQTHPVAVCLNSVFSRSTNGPAYATVLRPFVICLSSVTYADYYG